MRKAAFLALPIGALMLFSCKEISPAVDFGPVAADTSFMASPEVQTQRLILIEEFTGVSCPPCHTAHETLKAIEDSNPGRVVIIGTQPFGVTQANPYDKNGIKTIHDNRNQKGTDLKNTIFGGASQIPLAGIDRIAQDNSLYLKKEDWPQIVSDRVNVSSPANIQIHCTYSANRKVIIKVHVAYTSNVPKKQLLSVAITEDHVIDAQEIFPVSEQNYEHQHVLRDILTAPTGTAILSDNPTIAAGQVYERTFIYDLSQADPTNLWNPDNCKVAYVSNDEGADKEIIQAAEADLK